MAQPDEKPTVEFDKPPPWAISLAEKVSNGFQQLNSRMATLEANSDIQGNAVRDVQQRITRLELRQDGLEQRQTTNSTIVKKSSEVDLEHEAAIARLVTKVDALASRPDTAAVVLDEVRKLAGNPIAKKIGAAVLPVLMLAISLIGIRLQMKVSELEAKPAAVQPAPTVYLPAPATALDGGVQ